MMDLKGSDYWKIFAEVWKFFASGLPVGNTDEYWLKESKEVCQASQQFDDTEYKEFAFDLFSACFSEFERIWKKQQGVTG